MNIELTKAEIKKLKYRIKVMKASLYGADIESKSFCDDDFGYNAEPAWLWDQADYRVAKPLLKNKGPAKPKTDYKPYIETKKEWIGLFLIQNITTYLIINVNPISNIVILQDLSSKVIFKRTLMDLFYDNYIWGDNNIKTDRKPFGRILTKINNI